MVIIPTNLSVEMLLALLRSSVVKMVDAFQIFGNAIQRMIVEMAQTKVTSAQRKLALTSNSLVLELVIVFLNLGFAMAMTIASINR